MDKQPKPSAKWKDKLLSSSLPLEFDAAKVFIKSGFWIAPEYSYSRLSETGSAKDFSVDFVANGYPMFADPNDVRAEVQLPVECKYRTRNKRWLFLPEAEDEATIIPSALCRVDQFSAYKLPHRNTDRFNGALSVAYKGVEINLDSGDVHDAELRHGINQLKYAVPPMLIESIDNSVGMHPEDARPLFICGILVTTAPLLMLKPKVSLKHIERAESLDELTKEVPYLAIRTGSGPDFLAHVVKVSDNLSRLEKQDTHHILSRRSEPKEGVLPYGSPLRIIRYLEAGLCPTGWFETFVVCNFLHLSKLVRSIVGAVEEDIKGMECVCPAMIDRA